MLSAARKTAPRIKAKLRVGKPVEGFCRGRENVRARRGARIRMVDGISEVKNYVLISGGTMICRM